MTATSVPLVTVCQGLPDAASAQPSLKFRLLRGDEGVFIDRTTTCIDDLGSLRQVCGHVDSHSPCVLATFAAGPLCAGGFEAS